MEVQMGETPVSYKEEELAIEQEITDNSAVQQPLQAEHAQQRYKSFQSILLVILNISLSSYYFGYTLAYLSSIEFQTIERIYGITWDRELSEGLLMGCIPIGGGIGALLSSCLISRYSRKQSLLIVNAIALVTGLFIYIPTFETLVLARLVQGCCSGLFSSIAPLIMKELSPTEISGTLTSFNQIMIAFGVFFAFTFSEILEAIFNDGTGASTWWIMFMFSSCLVVTQILILKFRYNFQTPKYLLLHQRDDEAKSIIQRIYKDEFVDSVLKEIRNDIGLSSVNESSASEKEIEKSERSTPFRATAMAFHLATLQQFCGINAVITYGGEIVGEEAPSLKLALPIIINLEQVIASLLTSYLLTRLGRVILLQGGCIGAGVACATIGLGFWISSPGASLAFIILGLVIFMANFGLTLGPVVWVYMPEIVQPRILSYAAMINWINAAIITLLFPIIKEHLPNKNPAPLFLFFSIWCFVSLFINKRYLIETKGKGQKEIAEAFSKKAD